MRNEGFGFVILAKKQLRLPELLPKGMNYEGICEPYTVIVILNLLLTELKLERPLWSP